MENLEDTSTSGRVTRSLRKRLTSVDSDASSRPSTPQLTKLSSIPETSSPSRALRGTRRNSTTLSATPSKTPGRSKTVSISESNIAESSPAKRATRKSSISAVDLQTPLKMSSVDKHPLKGNETNEINTKETPAKRTRRLTSQTDFEKTPRSGAVRKKPGPKSRRSKQESESDSEIEVINLEAIDEQINIKENANSNTPIIDENLTKTPVRMSPRLKAKSVSPTDNTVIETIDLLENTRTSHDTEECDDNSTVSMRIETNENMDIPNTKIKSFNKTEEKDEKLESLDSSSTGDTLVKEIAIKDLPNKSDYFDHNDVNIDATAQSPHKSISPLNISKPIVESVVILQKISPKVIEQICGKTTAISSPANSKSVTFRDIDVDDEVKNSYPKTPVSIKSRSYIAMDSTNNSKDHSFQNDKESNGSFKDTTANIEISKDHIAFEIPVKDSKDPVEFHDATNYIEKVNIQESDEIVSEYTPQKKELPTKLQTSTPMLDSVSNSKPEVEKLVTNSSMITNTLEEKCTNQAERVTPTSLKQVETTTTTLQHEQKDVKMNDKSLSLTVASTNLSNDGEKTEDLFSKSWTHNVSGCATSDGKIDILVVTTNDEEAMSQPLQIVDEQKPSPTVYTRKETHNENDEQKEEEEEEKEEEEENDDESFQKLGFFDDEAMEVDGSYESGDSMDEVERKEILENQILDEGESIGSEDTEESNEEYDEENASFITSDSEDSLADPSHIDEQLKIYTKKSNKRTSYLITSDTSESEDDNAKNFRNNSGKKKKMDKSKRKNCMLSSSESEIEEQRGAQFVQISGKHKSSDMSEKPLTFEVSRMIDDTTDDDDYAKADAKSSKSQHAIEATITTESKCSNDQDLETNVMENTQKYYTSNDISNDLNNMENSKHEQETKNETEINPRQEKNIESEINNAIDISETVERTNSTPTNQGNEVVTNGPKSRRSQSLSRSLCQNIPDDYNDNEETLYASKGTSCDKDNNNKCGFGVITSQKNMETNTLNRSMERPIRKSINSGHESNKTAETTETTETIEDAEIINIGNKSVSNNDYDSSDNINERMIVDEETKSNGLNGVQSQNESNDGENVDGEDIEIPETQEVAQASKEDSSDESPVEEIFEELTVGKSGSKLRNSGLSLSFCQPKQKRITVKDRIRHSSFTIGVCVTKTEDNNQLKESGSSDSDEKEKSLNSEDSDRSVIDKQDEEELEKLAHSHVQFSIENRKRKSMLSSFAQDNQEFACKKKSKRNSLQYISSEDFIPSKSFIENIEKQKHEFQSQKCAKKSRLSKSFCGPIQDEMETLADSSDSDAWNNTNSEKINSKGLQNTELETHSTAPKSRLSKSFCGLIQENSNTLMGSKWSKDFADESVNKKEINESTSRELVTTKNKKKDFGRILDRCDEILDAANRTKLECKQNYKKSRLIIPKSKKESKPSLRSDEESANDAHEIKNDMKHSKDKTTLALEQAFRASANILLKDVNKTKKEKLSLPLNEEKYADKRLPMHLLESISKSQSTTETKKSKRERTREPLVQRLNCATGEIVEEVLSPTKKKRAILNKIELPTGTVLEEPVTPKKKRSKSGFRESPITPRTLGFKVRHVLTGSQDKVPQVSTSYGVERKRKQKIVEPKLILPKPQWSQSGIFLEEVLPARKMQGVNATQTCGQGVNEATVNALNFKNSTLFRKNVPREASNEMLKRKERQYVRTRF